MNKGGVQQSQGGYILLFNAVILISISFFLIIGLLAPLISSNQSAVAMAKSTRSFIVGNSATEEAIYRLKNGYTLNASEMIELGTATATILVSSGSDTRTIRVDTENDDYFRNIETTLSTVEGVSFNYGLQAGRGGFQLSGSATVNGNVYSNGDIIGVGSARITGGAIVATQSSPSANQTSTGVVPPTTSVSFGSGSAPQDFAQSFSVSTTTPVTSVRLNLRRSAAGWMNNITLRIVTNNGSNPYRTTLASANIDANLVTTSFNYITVPLTTPVSLTPGTTYWIVLDTGSTWGMSYSVAAAADAYAGGVAKIGTWSSSGSGGTWGAVSPSNLDAYFDIYVGGDTGLISGVDVGDSGGDAWAHNVQNVTATGLIYCQAGSGNNKACDTSRPDPTEQPFPISDGNIEDWKDEAEEGGTTIGNVSYGGSSVNVIGPGKIVGDLTLGASSNTTINGTLYVTGNISVSGSAILRLSLAHGTDPGVIVTDGKVSLGGSGFVGGNGLANSYLLLVTTSTCPTGAGCSGDNAIELVGATNSVILNAQKGFVEFGGSAAANQVTAYGIVMPGASTVNYLSGIADVNFSSGPGGSWSIDSWQEI